MYFCVLMCIFWIFCQCLLIFVCQSFSSLLNQFDPNMCFFFMGIFRYLCQWLLIFACSHILSSLIIWTTHTFCTTTSYYWHWLQWWNLLQPNYTQSVPMIMMVLEYVIEQQQMPLSFRKCICYCCIAWMAHLLWLAMRWLNKIVFVQDLHWCKLNEHQKSSR